MNGSTAAAGRLVAAGFGGEILTEAPLAPYTTWRIGGPAELLATPRDVDDVACAVRWASAEGLCWRVLGNGSNLLVRDEGVRGLVLRLRRVLDRVCVTGHAVETGAGASFPAVARRAASAGLAGLEFGAGIPGTIGGALVMNAGWHEFEIGNLVETVEFLDAEGRVHRLDAGEAAFRYRGSALRDRHGVVLAARLRLDPDDPERIRSRMETFAASRKENQPTEQASCGSVFLKPPGDFAGRLIEQAGLKGARVGAVEVSRLHANFFVNLGGGTASDALTLVQRVEGEVERRFGVKLVREFELW